MDRRILRDTEGASLSEGNTAGAPAPDTGRKLTAGNTAGAPAPAPIASAHLQRR